MDRCCSPRHYPFPSTDMGPKARLLSVEGQVSLGRGAAPRPSGAFESAMGRSSLWFLISRPFLGLASAGCRWGDVSEPDRQRRFTLYFPPFSLLHPFVSNNEHEAPETASSTGACRSPLQPSTCLPLPAVRGCGAPYNLASLMTPKTGVGF